MNDKFARLLDSQQQVKDFLSGTLAVDLKKFPPNIIAKIITCEKGVLDGIVDPTSTSNKFRDIKYSDDSARLQLRKEIVEELFSKKLLENDNHIKLGKGGARPNKLKKKQAFILIGLPASGKSSVAIMIAEKYGAIILDSDFAKRKLPEYSVFPWGASLVNSESSWITFGIKNDPTFESLYAKAISKEYSVVIPKIGAEPGDIIPYCENLKRLKYEVHLVLVYLPKEKSTVRALTRYRKSNRYVPLSLIFDTFGNNPALSYFLLKNKRPKFIDTFCVINTDVAPEEKFVCTDYDIRKKSPAIAGYKIDNKSLI